MNRILGISRVATIVVIVVILVLAAAIGFVIASQPSPSTSSSTTGTTGSSSSTSSLSSSLSSSSSSTSTSSSSSSSTFSIPSSLKYESTYKPFSLDPASAVDPGSLTLFYNVYEKLVFFQRNSSLVVPWLAKNWTVSANGTAYTFQLEQGVKFQDGSDFNASVAKFSLDRTVIMNQPTGYANFLDPVVGVQEYRTSNMTQANVSTYLAAGGINATGPYTLQIKLKAPYAPFLYVLAGFETFSMVSEDAVMANGGVVPGQVSDYMNSHMIGTGPYGLQTYDTASGNAVLQTWSGYWGGPGGTVSPKIKTIFDTVVPDENTEVLDLKAGAADAIYLTGTSSLFQLVDENIWKTQHKFVPVQGGISIVGPIPAFSITQFSMNFAVRTLNGSVASFQPFSDIRVREAFAVSFNQSDYISSQLNGLGSTINGPVPNGVLGYNQSIPPYQFNLTLANQLLVQAGPSVGFSTSNPQTIPVYYGAGQPDAGAAAAQIASNINSLQVGLNLAPTPLQFPQLISYYFHQQFIFGIFGIGRPGDADFWLQDYGNGNTGQLPPLNSYNNTGLTQIILQQETTSNTTQRVQLIHQAITMIDNDYAYIWVDQDQSFYPMSSLVGGAEFSPSSVFYYFAQLSFS